MQIATKIHKELEQTFGDRLQEHVSLREVTPFGVGGVADFLFRARTVDELLTAVTRAHELDIPWFIIGTGSQTILSDFGFPGLVIVNETNRVEFVEETGQVMVDTGVQWPQLVLAAANRGLGGVESFLTLSGTIGGSLWNHRVGFPSNPRSILRQVTVVDDSGQIFQMAAPTFYETAHSVLAVLIAQFQLVHTRRDETVRRIALYEKERRTFQIPGSAWLGPVFHSDFAPLDPSYLPAIFERAKVLGLRNGGAVFSERRQNFIEARGRITAHDIRALIEMVLARTQEVARSPLIVQIKFFGGWEQPEYTVTED